jgi:ornithine cyclodeaminase/alanine dehydrogenase-like protein (mu-crystallin family)
MVRLFTEAKIEKLLPMEAALDAVEASLRGLAAGAAFNHSRRRIYIPEHAVLHAMDAAIRINGRWYCGAKIYASGRLGASFVVALFDGETGEALALFEADRLGQRRTGAASGIATKLLSSSDARRVGLIGAGWQAQSQLEAICMVRSIDTVRVFSRRPESRAAFAAQMKHLNIDIQPVSSADEAVEGADIVITATSSRDPVLPNRALGDRVHINAIGANSLNRHELEPETVRHCDRIVVDSLDQCAIEAGDLNEALGPRDDVRWSRVEELGTALHENRARKPDERRTLFKSTGLATWDIACAATVFNAAR